MFAEIFQSTTSLQTLVASLAILMASLLFKWLTKVQNRNSRYDNPPFLTTGALHGLRIFYSKERPFTETLLELSRKFGYKSFQVQLPHINAFFTADFDVCKEILYDRSALKADVYKYYKILHDGGDDIFTSEGSFWRHSRKGMAPAFTSAHIRRMNETVVERVEDFIDKRLNTFARTGESFDIGNELVSLTLSIICKAAFDYEITHEEESYFLEEIEIGLDEIEKGRIPFRWRLGNFITSVRRAREAGRNNLNFAERILDSYRKCDHPKKGTVIDLIANNPNYKTDKVWTRYSTE